MDANVISNSWIKWYIFAADRWAQKKILADFDEPSSTHISLLCKELSDWLLCWWNLLRALREVGRIRTHVFCSRLFWFLQQKTSLFISTTVSTIWWFKVDNRLFYVISIVILPITRYKTVSFYRPASLFPFSVWGNSSSENVRETTQGQSTAEGILILCLLPENPTRALLKLANRICLVHKRSLVLGDRRPGNYLLTMWSMRYYDNSLASEPQFPHALLH